MYLCRISERISNIQNKPVMLVASGQENWVAGVRGGRETSSYIPLCF